MLFRSVDIRAESQKIAVWVKLGLLYRVQHPGRHLSRLQMIWRATSGKDGGDSEEPPPHTLVGLRATEVDPVVNRLNVHPTCAQTAAQK